jgi:hypothetical protein
MNSDEKIEHTWFTSKILPESGLNVPADKHARTCTVQIPIEHISKYILAFQYAKAYTTKYKNTKHFNTVNVYTNEKHNATYLNSTP